MSRDFHFSPDISKANSFDFLRFLFAFSMFVAHFGILTSNQTDWYPISSAMGVAGFFIISGFLITRSYCYCKNLKDYVIKRIRRIIPAYAVVVAVCAVFLSLLSSLSFQEYFSSKEFFRYFAANIATLNFIQPTLPEVFTNNTLPYVNGSLWTIKVEICLYALVPIVILFIKSASNENDALCSITSMAQSFSPPLSEPSSPSALPPTTAWLLSSV